MEKRVLGSTGLSITALGFGGAEIGYQGVDTAAVTRLLNEALDAGLNVIDTAECYSNGVVSSEELIGEAVSHRRNEYYLFTKCGHASGIATADWAPETIAAHIDRSLKRLKTDHLDLVQLHSCSLNVLKDGSALEAVKKAQLAGKVRYIGYSGDNEAAQYAVESGEFETLQCSISLVDQSALEVTLPAAAAKNMGVIVKRPIGNAVWRYIDRPDNDYVVDYWERWQALKYPFASLDSQAVGSVALRFTLSQPGVTTAIVGTTQPGRWQSNAKTLREGPLSVAEIAAIRQCWGTVCQPDWTART